MQKTVIAVTVAGLAFVVVSLWVLRTEPAGPLLFLPNPASGTNAQPQDSQVPPSVDGLQFDPPPLDLLQSTAEESLRAPVASDHRREEVRRLIRRLRPDHPESAIDIWVEEFAELPDDEIIFLLNQLGGHLSNAPGDVLSDGQPMFEENATRLEIQEQQTGSAATQSLTSVPAAATALQNLQNCTTVGYREAVELQVRSAGSRSAPRTVIVQNFACGDAQETGDPLHLALRTPGPVFFHLEDGRLTRNGMFNQMSDGRLGLPADEGWIALHQSPTLTANSTFTVDSAGHVQTGPDQIPAGRITVVRAEDTVRLTTDDGVYFQANGDIAPAAEFQLQSGAVELSNVDVDRNRSVMHALQQRGTTD